MAIDGRMAEYSAAHMFWTKRVRQMGSKLHPRQVHSVRARMSSCHYVYLAAKAYGQVSGAPLAGKSICFSQ